MPHISNIVYTLNGHPLCSGRVQMCARCRSNGVQWRWLTAYNSFKEPPVAGVFFCCHGGFTYRAQWFMPASCIPHLNICMQLLFAWNWVHRNLVLRTMTLNFLGLIGCLVSSSNTTHRADTTSDMIACTALEVRTSKLQYTKTCQCHRDQGLSVMHYLGLSLCWVWPYMGLTASGSRDRRNYSVTRNVR